MGDDELHTHRLHDVVLQTLDRKHNGTLLKSSDYAKTLSKWEGKPVYFGNAHPIPKNLEKNPEAELKRCGARLVGSVANPHIAPGEDGIPQLRSTIDITGSEGVEKLVDEGFAIKPSTGLWMRPDGADPHHVLIFNEGGDIQAGDRGAFIINQQELNELAEDETPGWFKRFIKEHFSKEEPEPEPEPEPKPDELIANLKKELEETKATAEKAGEDFKTLTAQLEEAKAELEKVETEKKDAAWNSFKAKVPKGMLTDEKAARTEFDENAANFALKVLTFVEDRPEGTGEEGVEHTPPPVATDPNAPYMTVFAPEDTE